MIHQTLAAYFSWSPGSRLACTWLSRHDEGRGVHDIEGREFQIRLAAHRLDVDCLPRAISNRYRRVSAPTNGSCQHTARSGSSVSCRIGEKEEFLLLHRSVDHCTRSSAAFTNNNMQPLPVRLDQRDAMASSPTAHGSHPIEAGAHARPGAPPPKKIVGRLARRSPPPAQNSRVHRLAPSSRLAPMNLACDPVAGYAAAAEGTQ